MNNLPLLTSYLIHNRFREGLKAFNDTDPHLLELSKLEYQHSSNWWKQLNLDTPGIYILTGGRQVGKSTSCKLLIKHCLEKNFFSSKEVLYLPCDEIYNAKELGETIRTFLNSIDQKPFLLIIDEITFVKDWDRVIKALADEGHFKIGICLLTGSDTLILKDAAMSFPGRRGKAAQTDFHLYPLNFSEYVKLRLSEMNPSMEKLEEFFKDYLICGGYLRAINDLAEYGKVTEATYATYEQWIRGDFLKQGKNEDTLIAILNAIHTIGVSQVSYSRLTQKIGLISKETCIDYCRLLERMDILVNLQAFDQNKKQGFPRKDRKFHFTDPFIHHTILKWLKNKNFINSSILESTLVEACVASHCYRLNRTFYFKGQGEVDIILVQANKIQAIEIKWANQISPNDLKTLKQFKNKLILTKLPYIGTIENIKTLPVYQFLYDMEV